VYHTLLLLLLLLLGPGLGLVLLLLQLVLKVEQLHCLLQGSAAAAAVNRAAG
jgi:hypothetical protein